MRPGLRSARSGTAKSALAAASPARASLPVRARAAASVGPDPAIGHLFTELRRALGISIEALASILATPAGTIAALEAGDVARLPAWPETERVVRTYTALAGIDPAAMLLRIRARLDAENPLPRGREPVPRSARAPLGPQPDKTVPRRKDAGRDPAGRARHLPKLLRRIPLTRRRAAIGTAVGIVAAGFLTLGPLASALPAPVQRAIGAAVDRIGWGAVTLPDGMRLIDPADPRSRRGDKLQTAGR